VRYELLSLTLAVCVALALARRWRAAALTGSLSLVPLIAFSAYLHSLGLPLLPTSVLVKASAFSGGTGLDKALSTFRFNLEQALVNHERLPIFALTLFFAALALHIRTAGRRLLFASVSAVGMLQLLFGHFAWFHRYDVYALIFLTLVCLSVVAERPTIFFPYFALGLALLAAPYFEATAQTPLAQSDIYNQQFQMHRFVRSFYTGNYAVNDLGWTSFERRPGAFVLDLYGLGSVEASHHPEASPAWLDDVTRRHHADLAIIYAEWFHVPADWQAMARMCLPSRPVVAAEPCVVFYSTNPAATAAIQADLEAFEPTLPGDISFSLNPHLNPEQIPFERP
jgi:hypothetical protein